MELLQQWLFGNLEGFGQAHDWEASSVVRVIFVGNSIKASSKPKSSLHYRPANDPTKLVNIVKSVDSFVHNLAQSVNVDLMLGEFDPSHHMLPQQTMHHWMLPRAILFQSFRGVPNPYAFEMAGQTIVGTSSRTCTTFHAIPKLKIY